MAAFNKLLFYFTGCRPILNLTGLQINNYCIFILR
jgi:hypothetical protein